MRMKMLFLLLVSSFSLGGCASSGSAKLMRSDFAPTFPLPSGEEDSIDGVWYHDTYGFLVHIVAPNLTYYHRAESECWEEKSNELRAGFLEPLTEYSTVSDGSSLFFRAASGAPEFQYIVQPELPEECKETPDRDATLDAFSALFGKHYAYFSNRNLLWPQRKSDVAARVGSLKNDDELESALIGMLEGLGDPDVAFRSHNGWWTDPDSVGAPMIRLREGFARQKVIADFGEYVQLWHRAVRERIRTSVLSGEHFLGAGGSMLWGTTVTGAGFLQIESLDVGEGQKVWEKSLRDAAAYLQKRPALILDLSIAEGGDEQVARMVASAFVDKGVILYAARPHQDVETDWQDYKSSSRLGAYEIPIFMLTSEHTAGAAERVVMALRGREGIVQVGSRTRGAMSGPLIKSLPNGWLVQLGAVVYSDREHVTYDGIGLAPDFALALYPEGQLSQGHHGAVVTLADLIAEGHFDAEK